MSEETLTNMLFNEMEKLKGCSTREEIEFESMRADKMGYIADKLIRYGELQVKAFDILGDGISKKNLKRLC